jgi:plastocyanin
VLDGRCYGTPTAYNGRIYMQTTKKLYCFGSATPASASFETADAAPDDKWPEPGPAKTLQIEPSELLLQPGDTVSFHVRELDANGLTVKEIDDPKSVQWASFIPPTAKVKAKMNASFNADGQLVAAPDKAPSAGAFEASADGLKGYMRGRVLPGLPISQDFESMVLDGKDHQHRRAAHALRLSAAAVDRGALQIRGAGQGREQVPGQDD